MILVTGASGLIGRAVAARYIRAGRNVRLQARSARAVADALYSLGVDENLQVVELDFASADQPDYSRMLAGCTTVVHCAGLVHNPKAPAAEYEHVNFRATKMLAEAAKKAKCENFVFLSTSAVYGSGPFVDVPESGATKTETPYAVSKLRCEELLTADPPAPKTVILRPSLVFGEGDRGNMLSLLKQIDKGLYFHIGGNKAKKSLIYSGDVAVAIEKCVSAAISGVHVFNVANPVAWGVIELSNEMAVLLNKPAPPTVPEFAVRAAAAVGGAVLRDKSPLTIEKMNKLMTTTTCSVDQLVKETGFYPETNVADALSAEILWARNRGLISARA